MKNSQKGFINPLIIIILTLALAGGIYIYSIQKNTITDNTEVNTKVSGSKTVEIEQQPNINSGQTTSMLSAGIILTSIKPNDLVKMPIAIEGYLDGKGWTANEGEIGLVEIFDANGKSVSNKEIIRTTTDWLIFPTYFKATVGDREMMGYVKTDTGTIKITNNSPMDGEPIKTILIPVRFK
jgi:hypothetical protein